MPTAPAWLRLLILAMLVLIGATVTRGVTQTLHGLAIHRAAPSPPAR